MTTGRAPVADGAKRVLVVEDDPSIMLGLRINLEAEGYLVLPAEDGEKGLELARSERPDLVILDVMLPRMNGFQVLQTLRREGMAMPIIVVSARTGEMDKVTGLELGNNAAAALITRGMVEITRLAIACGGRAETMSGLSGIGDLVLTCTGGLSRNRAVGVELGKGRKLPEILAGLHGKVAEGVRSTTAALGLAQRYGVEMPITEQMAAVLHEDKSPLDAIRDLMSRPGRTE